MPISWTNSFKSKNSPCPPPDTTPNRRRRTTRSAIRLLGSCLRGSGMLLRRVSTSLPSLRLRLLSRLIIQEEIERLKRELGRVSKQLTLLEQDCLQLQNERDKKEEQLKSIFSQIEAKDVEVECRKSKNLEYGFHTRDHAVISPGFQNANSSNDQGGSRVNSACETDLHVRFGCLSFYSKASTSSPADERSSDVGLQDHMPPAQSVEAAKVSHLYSMLTKINTGMVKLVALLEALVNLCRVENDVIVYRSLRVLRIVLNYTFGLEMESHESVL